MSQSADAFAAINNLFNDTMFPEFQNNSIFISGESYGGIYVPYLAWRIHQNNLKSQFKGSTLRWYNLTGFFIGNGATNWLYDVFPSFPEVVANFQLIPPQLLA